MLPVYLFSLTLTLMMPTPLSLMPLLRRCRRRFFDALHAALLPLLMLTARAAVAVAAD